jgi:hypothetical protein
MFLISFLLLRFLDVYPVPKNNTTLFSFANEVDWKRENFERESRKGPVK